MAIFDFDKYRSNLYDHRLFDSRLLREGLVIPKVD